MANYTKSFKYPIIDSKRTGKQIKMECQKQGLSVKKIQELLHIGAAQSIYDWYQGKSLPALDNMLALSHLLNIPIENLIVCRKTSDRFLIIPPKDQRGRRRTSAYYQHMCAFAA